jgi:hypothetical protein
MLMIWAAKNGHLQPEVNFWSQGGLLFISPAGFARNSLHFRHGYAGQAF